MIELLIWPALVVLAFAIPIAKMIYVPKPTPLVIEIPSYREPIEPPKLKPSEYDGPVLFSGDVEPDRFEATYPWSGNRGNYPYVSNKDVWLCLTLMEMLQYQNEPDNYRWFVPEADIQARGLDAYEVIAMKNRIMKVCHETRP